MATVTPSDLAPDEAVHYSFAGVEFNVGGPDSVPFESTDGAVLDNAASHPWLKVTYPAVELVQGDYIEQIDPTKDPMSSAFPFDPNDPANVKIAEDAKRVDDTPPQVAVEAGLDQTSVVTLGDTPETLAAAPADAAPAAEVPAEAPAAVVTTDTPAPAPAVETPAPADPAPAVEAPTDTPAPAPADTEVKN